MKMIFNNNRDFAVTKNNDGSNDLRIRSFDDMYVEYDDTDLENNYNSTIESILHTGRRFISIYDKNGATVAEDPVQIYKLGEDSLVYVAKNFEVVNPEDAAASTHAVVIALNAEDPKDLVYFTKHTAQEMTDDEKLGLYQECIYRSPDFALAIHKSLNKDFGSAPAYEHQTVDDSWLHYDKLDVFNIPVLGDDHSFPSCTMVIPPMYLADRW